MERIKFYKSCKLYGRIQEAVNLYTSGESINTIADRYNMNSAGVSRAFAKLGIKTRNMSEANMLAVITGRRKYISGKGHASWKGGKTIHENGYILVKCPGHPRAHKYTNYVFEHILIAEKKIGRFLKENECTHHINGIKTDNRPKNITVMTKSNHMKLHAQKRKSIAR